MSASKSQESNARKLLVVTYDYPPVTSAGMYRMVGMTKYLARLGWDITVLTVEKSFVYSTQESLDLIPENVRVIRTGSIEVRRTARVLVGAIKGKGTPSPVRRVLAGVVSRVFTVIERATTFPDPKAGWMPFLYFRLRRLLDKGGFDAVLSSSPPHSLHIPLLLARSSTRFRWVVDFRDPWTIPARASGHAFAFGLWRKLEMKILSKCDAVVANTSGNREALRAHCGGEISSKTVKITNGFDRELTPVFNDGNGGQTDDEFVYMGHVYPGMLDAYIAAVRYMRAQNHHRIPRLCIYGRVPGKQELPENIDEDLRGLIRFERRVPFMESLGIIENARNLLLLVPHGAGFETWVPSKLYPYLLCSTPILVVGPEGDAARIVTSTGRGMAVTSREACDVAFGIGEFLSKVNSGELNLVTNETELEKYSMQSISSQMDVALRRVVEE